MKSLLGRWVSYLALFVCLAAAYPATASEHGGEGAAAPAPMTFLVNVGNSVDDMHVLQTRIVLEYASPEVGARFAAILPKIQHHIILLLCGESVTDLLSSKGKDSLQEKIADDLNKILDETRKTGIAEVLFTDFIVQ